MSKPGEKNRLNEDHGRKQSSSLANGMDSHPVCGSAAEKRSHWRSYKLIIDPALKKGQHKLYRYDGQTFNMPNPGIPPVDIVRDPRIGRLWTKYKETDLPVPTFKIDECYIGPVPPKEVTFARLNDNIREGFLTDMCKKFGELEHVEILYNPKNKKHLGVAKVVFENVKAAKAAVQSLHKTSVMGNFIHVELDPKGENRLRYFQLLMNGSYTPLTLPVGGEETREVSPRSLAEALLACEPIRRLSESSVSAVCGALPPSSSTTPVSLETGYSSLRQDTPQSQGTPHTPRQSGTPFSQESNFSSRQSTPVYPSSRAESSGSYKSRRHESKFQDAYNRRPERPQYRSNMYRSTTSEPAPFKQNQLTPPEPPPSTPSFTYTPPLPATPNFKSAFSPYQAPLPPAFPPSEPAFHNAAQREGEYLRPPEPPLAAATDFLPVKERPETPPIPEPPPEPMPVPHPTTPPPQTPEHCPSPGSPTLDLERNSLDSRIEMLLKEKKTKLLPFLEERDSDTEVRMEGSPISSSSSQLSPIPPFTSGSQGGQQNSRPSSTGLEDISPTPLPESEDEDPTPGTAVLIKRISSPVQETTSNSDLKDGHPRGHTPTETVEMAHQSSGEDMEISDDEMPGTPNSGEDCGKGIVMNSAVSPMQTISIPPPGFPHQVGYQISHHHLAGHSAVPGHAHLAGHPGVPHHMLPHMNPYSHGMMQQMELMNCMRWEQWSTVPMSFQMQQQMLSRMAQTRGPYQYPHFMESAAAAPYGAPYQPVTVAATPAAGAAAAPEQQWQHPSIPKFNPTVPPPGYETKKEDPHKATVDGVLLVIVKELKAIMKRDLNRKMVEVVAFRAFDDWWEKKELSAKVSLTPVKGAEGKEDERPKPKETMGSRLLENWNKGEGLGYEGIGLGISLRGAIRLPSFKVKRKEPPEAAAAGDNKRARPSTPADDELEDEDRDRDPAELPLDDSKMDTDSASGKRRHSRPLELDSEGEEEVDTSGKEEESLSDREEEPDETLASDRLSSGKESADEDSSSESASSDSSDEEGENSASSKASSDSSAESADSSEYELSSEEEADEEEEEEEEAAVQDLEAEGKAAVTSSSSSSSSMSSSDEDERKAKTKAPRPPSGAGPEDTEEHGRREELSIKPQSRPPSPEAEVTEDLKPPSPKSIPVQEKDVRVDRNIPAVKEHVANLRPPTPTGALPDSDQEAKGKAEPEEVPSTPGRLALSQIDASTPAPKALSASLMHLPLLPRPAVEGRSLLHPPLGPLPELPQRARLSTDEDIPRTPGRDLMERSRSLGKSQSTDSVPVTPGSDAPLTGSSLLLISPHIPASPFSYPAQSPVLSAGVPRTPGRDLTFTPVFPDPTALAFNRKISTESLDERPVFKEPPTSTLPGQAPSAGAEPSLSGPEDLPAGLTVAVPAPSETAASKRKPGRPKGRKPPAAADESLDLSSDSALPRDARLGDLTTRTISAISAKNPHHPSLDFREGALKARTVLPDDDGFLSYEEEAPVIAKPTRRARRGWEELLLGSLSPVSSPHRPYFNPRSEFEEMTILYDIWNEGIDDEDMRLLQITYDKMLQQDNGNDWLNDTLWVNHPSTNIPRVKKKRRDDGMRDHVTGCARSEGYYKIDKKDKIKYLQSTKLQSDEPPFDTQGMSIPAQVHASTRAGSERRSEQRRLLSSFACDSDLLKFNQLKFRKKRIRFCKSHIHDWGLFAMEPIAADEMVIEYVGQNIRQVIADMREKRYEEEGIGSSYMFRVDHDTIIDATKCGNFARFINHSCNPNCYAKVITVESQKKIVIYSRQPINVNEEITYDYKFPIEDEKIPCLCGAENCRGTLN
ncbi:histone-lysine N-methyltransferase SETD1B-A isoform X2 [Pseudoliparis swirei]|uniref:histone-lysine N-methyltransferase SETD1B-A isoform X2 n=1 Tax=Pseudoliparis swirei TaxID=2059687 RepID=UPI0024BDD885|nr:histone-lysine N-methyltransferase SETD1B-A isoform X2 [Pseudoliparis swirei]